MPEILKGSLGPEQQFKKYLSEGLLKILLRCFYKFPVCKSHFVQLSPSLKLKDQLKGLDQSVKLNLPSTTNHHPPTH